MESPLYEFYADLKTIQQAFELGMATPAAAAHAVQALPSPMVAGVGFRVKSHIFEDQANTDYLDLTGATRLNMKARPAGYAGAATLLDAGTLAGCTPADGEALWTVDLDTTQGLWSTYDYVRVWWDIALPASNVGIILWQDIEFVSMDYFDGQQYPDSNLVPTFYVDVSSSDLTVSVYPGTQIIRVDTSAAARTITLPASADTDANGDTSGRIIIVHEAGSNDVNVVYDAGDTYAVNEQTFPARTITFKGIGGGLDLTPRTDLLGWDHKNANLRIG